MTDELQVLQVLFEVDPPRVDEVATGALEHRVMAILAANGSTPRRSRHKIRRFAAVGCALVAALSGGGVAYAHFAKNVEPSYRGEARCYTVASLKGGANFYGLTVAASGNPKVAAVVVNALATCEVDWREGFLGLGKRPLRSQLPPDQRTVPPLVACVLNDGVAAVFPGTNATCSRLGLSNEGGMPTGG